MNIEIKQLETDDDIARMRSLSAEYLRRVFTEINAEFQLGLDVDSVPSIIDEWMTALDQYRPPAGHFLLAYVDGQPAGMGALHALSDDICEIKRMYVRPAYRRQGLGRTILNALLKFAREENFPTVRLDSPRTSRASHALYRSVGFRDIEPYAESEAGEENAPYVFYMELKLDPSSSS